MTGPGRVSTPCARSTPTRSRTRLRCDRAEPSPERPLAGIPILVKDNIATGDRQHTTAGSLALAEARARRDATLVARLRAAGAVILGKANLTEFANILAIDMPSGYSSLGGQVRNPYAPDALDERGVPLVSPGGSSSGSAVAVAAGLCAAAIGTETSGSLLSPATQNGLVTVKPTVGLISRAGILPIAHSQDTAGPLDPHRARRGDPAERAGRPRPARPGDIGPAAAGRLHRMSRHGRAAGRAHRRAERSLRPRQRRLFRQARPRRQRGDGRRRSRPSKRGGATIVRANIPTAGWIGGPGTEMAILNRNPESPGRYEPARRPIVFVYELKHDLNAYLRDWLPDAHGGLRFARWPTSSRSTRRMPTGRCASGRTSFSPPRRRAAICRSSNTAPPAPPICAPAEPSGSTRIWTGTGSTRCCFPAPPGPRSPPRPAIRASRCRPGSSAGSARPDYPFGATFTGRAWSEPVLLRLAYAFEQATHARRPPPGLPPLQAEWLRRRPT